MWHRLKTHWYLAELGKGEDFLHSGRSIGIYKVKQREPVIVKRLRTLVPEKLKLKRDIMSEVQNNRIPLAMKPTQIL